MKDKTKYIVTLTMTVTKVTTKTEVRNWTRDALLNQAEREGWESLLKLRVRSVDIE